MRIRSSLLTAGGAAFLVAALLHGGAQAAPEGWKCSYGTTPPYLRGSKIYYSCSGKSLSETRARARAQCRRLDDCEVGACIPLDYVLRCTSRARVG
jgi:hypothetical protein